MSQFDYKLIFLSSAISKVIATIYFYFIDVGCPFGNVVPVTMFKCCENKCCIV